MQQTNVKGSSFSNTDKAHAPQQNDKKKKQKKNNRSSKLSLLRNQKAGKNRLYFGLEKNKMAFQITLLLNLNGESFIIV